MVNMSKQIKKGSGDWDDWQRDIRAARLKPPPGEGDPCGYCRRTMVRGTETSPTRDHYLPRSLGGTAIVMACYACNQQKGDMLPTEWDAFMAANPEWWRRPI